MCSNNCGRYVCAVHAVPRKGPGSAMICLSCAEALGLLEKPTPQPVVTPLVNIPSVEAKPQPVAEPLAATPLPAEPSAAVAKPDETLVNVPTPAPIVEIKPEPAETPISQPAPRVEARADATLPPQPAPRFDPDATLAGIVPPARPAPTQIKPSSTSDFAMRHAGWPQPRLISLPPDQRHPDRRGAVRAASFSCRYSHDESTRRSTTVENQPPPKKTGETRVLLRAFAARFWPLRWSASLVWHTGSWRCSPVCKIRRRPWKPSSWCWR
jgi:hypothetical protein